MRVTEEPHTLIYPMLEYFSELVFSFTKHLIFW